MPPINNRNIYSFQQQSTSIPTCHKIPIVFFKFWKLPIRLNVASVFIFVANNQLFYHKMVPKLL